MWPQAMVRHAHNVKSTLNAELVRGGWRNLLRNLRSFPPELQEAFDRRKKMHGFNDQPQVGDLGQLLELLSRQPGLRLHSVGAG